LPVLLVIPARYASTRFPGKPLAPLRGATGQEKPLIQRTWEAATQVSGIDRIVVATDDERIAEAARSFGAEPVMTPESCRNGTERCASVSEIMPGYDVLVNLQGDAPLTPPWFVEALVAILLSDPAIPVATPVLRCDNEALNSFIEDRRHGRVGATTAVFDRDFRALYFSKEVIPYTGRPLAPTEIIPVFHHVGVYAYRREPLRAYPIWPEGPLERWEGLEQLRFLENATPLRCVEVSAQGRTFWELNNPTDTPRIEAALISLQIP
jgi:3-deoxy-manno-octulosonate cytidylyltransferase (CMP-KDO synthetase)